MRQKKVWRYYCDHCRKAGCGKAAMILHEKHCTNNPKRMCRMCGASGVVEEAKQKVLDGCSADVLREACEGCPACMLSVVRQSKYYEVYKGENPPIIFDYKSESASWWKDVNESRDNNERYYGG